MTDERQVDSDEIPVITPARIDIIDARGDGSEWYRQEPQVMRPPGRRRRLRWPILLFIATCISTFLAGMIPGGGMPDPSQLGNLPEAIRSQLIHNGAVFSGSLMLILFCHEMGHYLQARRHRVHATFPFFIPMPFTPFGTMGAVIFQEPGVADRRQMFDIAVSGPLAGLIIALPIAFWGVQESVVAQFPPGPKLMSYGDPLILKWMIAAKHGPLAANQDILLNDNPLLFAGWVGIFITALNLLPVSQLDGGHVLYTLLGPPARRVAKMFMLGALAYMFMTDNWTYFFMWFLVLFMGVSHPPTRDDRVPLGTLRTIIGWATLAFIIVGFTPMPLQIQ
ncbi:MAG: site-2 protease family protein [Planctomycetota bacterium]|nr:site-2 protease family protein [Planctomycetota bacterium]MDA1210998.1 site-2 protease family protein [Planctomycetota bacterium]